MHIHFRLRYVCFLCLVLLVLVGCGSDGGVVRRGVGPIFEPRPPKPRDVWPPVAVWVVRQPYESPGQIAELMENCKQAGFNTVLFQVRGNGTAFYRSRIEPFAYEYGGDPGFDPFKVACREAHRRGLAIHVWVNVMPAWRGERPPTGSRQLYNAHPEWFWYDQKGKRQPLGWYVSLNPCLPAVRSYLVGVFEEIVGNYPVDGLHLDYIRFPSEESPKGSDYPYDRKTLALYKKATGMSPWKDRNRWSRWRTDQVTQLVRDIGRMVKRVRPSAKLTTACGADFTRYRKEHFQDGPGWVKSNLVDLVFVMNYCRDVATFRRRQEAWQRAVGGKPLAAGIGMYLHESDRVTIEQLKWARQWGGGVALFSDQVLFVLDRRSRQRLTSVRSILPAM